MAEISRLLFARHLRSEQSTHVLQYRAGELVRSGRGLSFWFLPMSASIAEIPIDDREQTFLFHGRTADFQEVTVQGVITYRVAEPEVLAQRVDFTLDLTTGLWRKTPLESLSQQLGQLAAQLADGVVAPRTLRDVLEGGVEGVRDHVEHGLSTTSTLEDAGLALVSVRVQSIAPTAELQKALQMPTREKIQQNADQATFARRALAVENERAIAENELHNRIELAKREQQLIEQRGANTRREAEEASIAQRIEAEGKADRARIEAAATAERITLVEGAKAEMTRAEIDVYRDVSHGVLLALAAKELASKLKSIDHLNVSPELLGPLLANLVQAGTRKLEA
ncbi:MAG: band 7 protein [Myxococcales bacterium]|nr:band 7 protein [Myxococcales bacterium]